MRFHEALSSLRGKERTENKPQAPIELELPPQGFATLPAELRSTIFKCFMDAYKDNRPARIWNVTWRLVDGRAVPHVTRPKSRVYKKRSRTTTETSQPPPGNPLLYLCRESRAWALKSYAILPILPNWRRPAHENVLVCPGHDIFQFVDRVEVRPHTDLLRITARPLTPDDLGDFGPIFRHVLVSRDAMQLEPQVHLPALRWPHLHASEICTLRRLLPALPRLETVWNVARGIPMSIVLGKPGSGERVSNCFEIQDGMWVKVADSSWPPEGKPLDRGSAQKLGLMTPGFVRKKAKGKWVQTPELVPRSDVRLVSVWLLSQGPLHD